MNKFLVAASPEAQIIIRRILAGYDLMTVETMARAEKTLRCQSFDFIFTTIAFDGSKMLDFVRLAKSISESQHIPIICARVRPNILRSPAAIANVAFTCVEIGAAKFLNITDYGKDPEQEMREVIDQVVTCKKRVEVDTSRLR